MAANPDNFEERVSVVVDTVLAVPAADPYFAGVPLLEERQGDINQTITAALSKLGLCVIVVSADADGVVRNGASLSMRVRLVLQVTELPLLNQGATGTKKPARNVAMRLIKDIDRKPNGLDVGQHMAGLNEILIAEDQPFKLTKDPRCIVYQVAAYTKVEL